MTEEGRRLENFQVMYRRPAGGGVGCVGLAVAGTFLILTFRVDDIRLTQSQPLPPLRRRPVPFFFRSMIIPLFHIDGCPSVPRSSLRLSLDRTVSSTNVNNASCDGGAHPPSNAKAK